MEPNSCRSSTAPSGSPRPSRPGSSVHAPNQSIPQSGQGPFPPAALVVGGVNTVIDGLTLLVFFTECRYLLECNGTIKYTFYWKYSKLVQLKETSSLQFNYKNIGRLISTRKYSWNIRQNKHYSCRLDPLNKFFMHGSVPPTNSDGCSIVGHQFEIWGWAISILENFRRNGANTPKWCQNEVVVCIRYPFQYFQRYLFKLRIMIFFPD